MAARFPERDVNEVPNDSFFEEEVGEECSKGQKEDKQNALCNLCFALLSKVPAIYLCYVCMKHYCEECFKGHDTSHKYINVVSEKGEKDSTRKRQIKRLRDERKRGEKLAEKNVCVCDSVDIKHGLDKNKVYCDITGLCGTSAGWVVCDYFNDCIKLFSFGTNVLQRYLRFGSKPWDVTEILEKQNSTELDSASSSSSNISGTDVKPDRKCLLAVTLPGERLILIIDLSKNPAEKVRNIKMEKECYGIEFYDDKIFTVCRETPYSRGSLCSVYIMSTEGVKSNIINTGIHRYWFWSYLTVLNGNVYTTDFRNHKVYCFNVEGRVVSQTTIEWSEPDGICVDRRNNKVFVCARYHHKVYELDSDLDRHKSVLDQTTPYMKEPQALCFYKNKLYVSHLGSSRVTVVRLV